MFRLIWKLIKTIFIMSLLIILLAAGCLGYAKFIEPDRLVVKNVSDISYSMKEPVTVAVFADTHFGFDYSIDDFEKIIDEINSDPPDIILFAGDLIDHLDEYSGDITLISHKLAELEANIGKYAVFGNHDYGGGAEYEYEHIMAAGGFTVLKNEVITIRDKNLRIIGIDDVIIGYGDPSVAYTADGNMYNLLLCHEPDIIESIADSNTDYMFSGHTHGGQIRIPYYTEMFLPAYGRTYVKGEYSLDNQCGTVLYVNPGLGTTKLAARFGAAPELTYLTINPAN